MSILPRIQAIQTQVYKKADAPVLGEFDSVLCIDDDAVYAYHHEKETCVLVLLYSKTMEVQTRPILRALSNVTRVYVYIPSRMGSILDEFECMQTTTTQTVFGQSLHVEMMEWKYDF